MTELVHLDVADRVATITLDSPANRNALSAQLAEELLGHLQTVADDGDVHVVVLAHTGPAFCAGADLKLCGSCRSRPSPASPGRRVREASASWPRVTSPSRRPPRRLRSAKFGSASFRR
jgi:enoyl-CoA hydratase/carnithine racemase